MPKQYKNDIYKLVVRQHLALELAHDSLRHCRDQLKEYLPYRSNQYTWITICLRKMKEAIDMRKRTER